MSKSGLSPQFIMRASLKRYITDLQQANDGENTPSWRKPDARLRAGESEIENLRWYADYSEPGYTAGERGVLTANWNYFTSNITDLLERAGFKCEWSDEWTECADCGKAIRTSGDCYFWQKYYVMDDCDEVCLNCVDWPEYLSSIEDTEHAVQAACDPSKYGYMRLSEPGEFENGFHPGQTDDPRKILASFQEQGWKHIVFRVPEVSQFYVTFETWVRMPSITSVQEYLEDRLDKVEAIYKATSVHSPDWSARYKDVDNLKDAITLARFAEAR